jgi:hypothetical protein
MIEAFRNEIIEAEKSRMDLLKWKLILVAALGAIGLGLNNVSLNSKISSALHLLLCLIPFACVYVDLLCKHLQIRILAISYFFQHAARKGDTDEISLIDKYEEFCESLRADKSRDDAFGLEDWAQQWSTVFLSILVMIAAPILKLQGLDFWALILSGMCGLLLTWMIDTTYDKKRKIVEKKAKNLPDYENNDCSGKRHFDGAIPERSIDP